MLGKIANRTLPGTNIFATFWNFMETFGLQLKVLRMKTKHVSNFSF